MENLGNSSGKRAYRQVRRAEKADETRRRILDAARACLTEGPLRSVSLDDIARQAGVARSTLHLVFGSRKDLFLALAVDVLARSGMANLSHAFGNPDAREAMRGSLEAATRMYAAEFAVSKALLSLAATDGDAAPAARRLNEGRNEGMENIARRLDEQGYLGPDVSRREAADMLWVITSYESFDLLYMGRGLTIEEATQRVTDMAERSLGIAAPGAKGDGV